jgi:hypothetical protein
MLSGDSSTPAISASLLCSFARALDFAATAAVGSLATVGSCALSPDAFPSATGFSNACLASGSVLILACRPSGCTGCCLATGAGRCRLLPLAASDAPAEQRLGSLLAVGRACKSPQCPVREGPHRWTPHGTLPAVRSQSLLGAAAACGRFTCKLSQQCLRQGWLAAGAAAPLSGRSNSGRPNVRGGQSAQRASSPRTCHHALVARLACENTQEKYVLLEFSSETLENHWFVRLATGELPRIIQDREARRGTLSSSPLADRAPPDLLRVRSCCRAH